MCVCFKNEQDLLRDTPLPALLEKDNELVHDVKSLDSDMQMLVYENYNKFIKATDTIRSMKVSYVTHGTALSLFLNTD